MSSLPPSQQSIAGGIFNTVSKLCNNLGLGIATSVNSAVAHQMTSSTPAIRPYLAVYWFAAAAAGSSLFMVPFLTLGTQGGTGAGIEKKPGSGSGNDVCDSKDEQDTTVALTLPATETGTPIGGPEKTRR